MPRQSPARRWTLDLRWLRKLPVLALFLITFLIGPVECLAQKVLVGAARIDITPTRPIRLSGYLVRSRETSKVDQRIWAKALAIGGTQNGKGPSLLVSVDNLGVPDELVTAVADRLRAEDGVRREQFVVASSHTHSAPCLTRVAPNIFGKKIDRAEQDAIDAYTRELTRKLVEVCKLALKNRRPGQISWSRGSAGFAANRRTKGGPVDHDLPVLKVTDDSNKLLAIVVNYACHCTTLNPDDNAVSGDWAGYAQEEIEKDHAGAVALTVIGCGADANPTRRLEPGAARDHGRAIADEVNRLLPLAWKSLSGDPIGALERIKLELGPLPTRDELLATIQKGGPAGYNASTQLEKMDRGEGLQKAIDYPIQTWRFGNELAMVFLPGEVVVDYALRLKKELDAKRLWVTAYANDVPCYIPSERILKEGGYEAGGAMIYYGRPAPFKPGLENQIISKAKLLLPGSFWAGPSQSLPARPAAVNDPNLPRSPEAALRSFHLPPGYRIELVACEPLVVDPVAVDFGTDGKLWVCEMRDYPTGLDNNWKPGGVIKTLEDRDGDGRYETATEFLTGLPFPTGLMAWRNGVLICAAPKILFAEDTNGDGKADRIKTLFQGFSTENYQARVNGLFYALDNWIYGANGLIGGKIQGMATRREVNIGGRDFRMRPDSGAFEAASGLTQQGRVQDDWGNQFGGNNSILIQHYPFPDHYARRNPRVASPSPSVYLPRGPDSTRLFPSSQTLDRYNDPQSANHVTSACSPLIFRDDLLGAEIDGNAFTSEPVHNLVHREVLKPDGVTFAGHRAKGEQSSEFLSSTDNWFRPVQIRTGPDGALWVVDMYRFLIEHPRWIDPARLATIDVRAGSDKGRIYRVLPADRPARPVPRLDRLSTAELARQLGSPNGTLRDMVQRLLAHRADRSAIPVLLELAKHGTRPQTRLQALCAIEGLNGFESADPIRLALDDPHPGVRRQALRLAETWFAREPSLGPKAAKLVDDPDPTVRFQLALSLGAWDDPAVAKPLATLALKSPGDRWILAAVLSSSAPQADRLLFEALEAEATPEVRMKLVVPLIATAAGRQNGTRVRDAVVSLTRPRQDGSFESWQLETLSRLFEAGLGPIVFEKGLPEPVLRFVRETVEDTRAKPQDRVSAIGLLARTPSQFEQDGQILDRLAESGWSPEGEADLARAIFRLEPSRGFSILSGHWNQWGPRLRATVLDASRDRAESMATIVEALSASVISASEINASFREQLLRSLDASIREKAAKVFATRMIVDRAQIMSKYQNISIRPGNAEQGKAVFNKVCSGCHRFGGEGFEVGPDLSALTETSPESLLTAILEPSREVDARYANYVAALGDGRVLNGLIASETANAITLKRQGGTAEVVLRSNLEELKTTGQSLMPDGLENDVSPAQMRDLIAYLQTRGTQPKNLAGNHPRTIRQGEDGSIRLTAEAAEVYGPSLIFESANQNLGNWHSPDDLAKWTFTVNRPGEYTLSMEWACADESAGNRFRYQMGQQTRTSTVGGTAENTWSRYHTIFVDEVSLESGTHRIEIRPVGELHNALMDLRGLLLTPRLATPGGN